MNKLISTKRLMQVGTTLGLALVVAGCGGTAVSHPTSKPSASSSTTPATTKPLTLAEATASGYVAKFPLVNCSTLSAAAQAAWTPLLAGSQVGKCAPANFLTADVPQAGVQVQDNDPNISQSQANADGKALLADLAWDQWSLYASAPSVLSALPLVTGSEAVAYQFLEGGGTMTSASYGREVYPIQITLLSLTTADQAILANTTDKFALVVSFGSGTFSYTLKYPSGTTPIPLSGQETGSPEIFTGTTIPNPVLGTYFKLNAFDLDCTSDSAAGICQAGGAA